MGLQLIPVGHARPIICLIVVMSMLKRYTNGFLEINRFLNMETVQAPFTKVFLRIAGKGGAKVGRIIFTGRKTPSGVKIIF